jgi:formylglycine-generating enzyme required for sulfatase activity
MGSPLDEPGHQESETSHRVIITHRFAIQNHEVTREDYRIYNLRPPADFEDCGAHCPAVNVTWWNAIEYANARSNQDELEECYVITGEGPNKRATWPSGFDCEGYRLATEAEWEYAARAGESRSVWGGFITEMGRTPVDPLLAPVAIYGANSAVEYPNAEQCSSWSPVGTHCGPSVASQRPANPWGLSDMLGNAAEWVWDFHAPLPADPQTNPTGPADGTDHVVRGCSYRDTGSRCRLAARQGVPTVGMRSVGFRLVRSVH